jgi:hypothetical protein
MIVRVVLVLAGLLAAMPAVGAELKPEEARRFVIGKLFAFNCFDGTSGAGRIQADGSAAGIVRFGGTGPIRSVALPAGTIRVQGETVCASLKGMFSPCFYLEKTSEKSFRGSIVGLSFAYCHFTRRGGRIHLTRAPTAASPRPSGSTAGVKDE